MSPRPNATDRFARMDVCSPAASPPSSRSSSWSPSSSSPSRRPSPPPPRGPCRCMRAWCPRRRRTRPPSTPSDQVVLTFNEAVNPDFVAVRVAGPDGDEADGTPAVEGPTVTQPLTAPLAAGEHTVTYRVVSVGRPPDLRHADLHDDGCRPHPDAERHRGEPDGGQPPGIRDAHTVRVPDTCARPRGRRGGHSPVGRDRHRPGCGRPRCRRRWCLAPPPQPARGRRPGLSRGLVGARDFAPSEPSC